MDEKVSVILPVYNVEEYLPKCMDSLLNQTYRNIEVIMVDDGSTDNSGTMCDEYATTDSRCKVYHKKNGGLSDARNYGLDRATGGYVLFVDSDDWLDRNYLAVCVGEMQKSYADCVMSPYVREYENLSLPTYTLGKEKLIFVGDVVRDKLQRRFFGLTNEELSNPIALDELNSAWGKLYRRERLQNLRFTMVKTIGSAEDVWFNAQVFARLDKVVYLPNIFTHYNKQNEGSIVHSYRVDLVITKNNLHNFLAEYIRRYGLGADFQEALRNRRALAVLDYARNILGASLSFIEKHRLLTVALRDEELRTAYLDFDFSALPIKWRIYYWLAKNEFILGVMIMTWLAERLKKYLR